MRKKVLFLLFNLLSVALFAQQGEVNGLISDESTKETLPGVKITVEGNGVTKMTMTDFDGKYSVKGLQFGTYTITTKYATFVPKKETVVLSNESPTSTLNIGLQAAVSEQQEVVVKATMRRDSEASILLDRKNAAVVSDGISAQSIKKAGDSDVSGAVKRITGVTIQNGKYVFVRGLGDRYTQTTLNGLTIPGLDPDVNAIQLDIFPTSIVDNLNVSKTASADLYGDFAGGIVNIITKKFPAKKTTQIGLGIDYNPSMHFNKDFVLYSKSSTDWLGFDDGMRQLPINSRTKIPDEVMADPNLQKITQSFNNELGVKTMTALPNGSFSLNHGNQITKNADLSIGYFGSINYSNDNIFYDNYETNEFLKDDNLANNNLIKWSARKGKIGKNAVNWSSLASLSVNYKKNSFQLTGLHTQNGESSGMLRESNDYNGNVSTLIENILTYSSRRLTTGMISGSHKLNRAEINWSNAFSISNVYEPDFRETKISVTNGDTTLSTGTGAGIDRFWRNLDEKTESFKGEFIYKFTEKTSLKSGVSGTLKWRDFNVYSYKHRPRDLSNINFDPNSFLTSENIWNPATRQGTYTIGNYEPANNFSASQNVIGGFLMMNHPIKKFLTMSYGVRVENAGMFYNGQNNTGSIKYVNKQTLDETNILPSANLNFMVSEKITFRLGAGNTVARPSFKEKSIAQIYDPITKRIFNGNINLKQTNISNFDARFEYFFSGTELFAISGFYKQFDGHIEMVSFATAPNNIMPRNSGFASILGTEIEFRKAFAKKEISPILSRFSLNLNVSLVASKVDLKSVYVDDKGQTEFELRSKNRRSEEGPQASTRPMAGQSPYVVNASISYDLPETESNITVSYNIQGEQLTVISSGRVPDVYTDPFNSLNINGYRSFGKNKNSKITLSVNNLLNDRIAFLYKSYNSTQEIYSSYNPGIQFSVKYNYTF